MPNGSDPRRRPDQQSPDPEVTVPPVWWSQLSEGRLPAEDLAGQPQSRWRGQLVRLGRRLVAPVVLIAVAAAVVAFSFGYMIVGGALAAAVVVGVASASVLYQRRRAQLGESGWWR
jgi:hypothetical protein